MSIEVRDVVVGYSEDIDILRGVSIKAERSKITAILGPNGSGKSTLLKTIYGFLRPKKGRIYYEGRDITGVKPHRLLSQGIAYIPQTGGIFPYLTVKENLQLGGWIFRRKRDRIEHAFARICNLYPDLKKQLNLKAGDLSGGSATMLKIAKALIANPRIMLVDEPTSGLAPKYFNDVYSELGRLAKEDQRTIILVDQNIRQAMNLADHVYILEMGKVKSDGPREEFGTDKIKNIIRDWLGFSRL